MSPIHKAFQEFYDLDTGLDLYRIGEWFLGAFATGVAYQQETFSLAQTWFRPVFGLAYPPMVQISFPEVAVIFPIFYIE